MLRSTFLDKYFVNHAVGLCLFGGEPMVAVAVGVDLLEGLAAVLGDDFVELGLEFLDFANGDFHVGSLTFGATHGLVDHHAAVGQSAAHAFLAGAEQYACHRGCQTGADGGNLRLDVLHGVVDAETCIYRSSGRVEVNLDVFLAVNAFEEKQLSLDDIGGVVVDGCAEEDDAVHHQAAEDVHLCNVQLTLFNDVRSERVFEIGVAQLTVEGGGVLGVGGAADAAMLGGVFFEFVHIWRFEDLKIWRFGDLEI